jgi:hypothetical protein
MLECQGGLGFCAIGFLTCQGFVQDNTKRVNVSPAVKLFYPFNLLWTHVGRRAQINIAGQVRPCLLKVGDAEIGQVRLFKLIEKDIGRLEIPVDDSLAVSEI